MGACSVRDLNRQLIEHQDLGDGGAIAAIAKFSRWSVGVAANFRSHKIRYRLAIAGWRRHRQSNWRRFTGQPGRLFTLGIRDRWAKLCRTDCVQKQRSAVAGLE